MDLVTVTLTVGLRTLLSKVLKEGERERMRERERERELVYPRRLYLRAYPCKAMLLLTLLCTGKLLWIIPMRFISWIIVLRDLSRVSHCGDPVLVCWSIPYVCLSDSMFFREARLIEKEYQRE